MKWERSRNRHGLWNGIDRLGYIGLAKLGTKGGRYYWFVDVSPWASGYAKTLEGAKQIIVDALEARGINTKRLEKRRKLV